MADVTLTYKGSDILELSDSGSATLKTGGKYCEDDVTVEYVKPSGGGDYSKLVPGTYGNIVVDSDGVLTCSTAVTAYALPLTKPIQINSGDVIKIAMLTTVRAYHVWRLMNGTTELQMKQTANFESPYITSITADFTGTVDNIKLAINPSASGATVKFAWFINNKIVLG